MTVHVPMYYINPDIAPHFVASIYGTISRIGVAYPGILFGARERGFNKFS